MYLIVLLDHKTKNRKASNFAALSAVKAASMVGVTGIEPAPSWSQTDSGAWFLLIYNSFQAFLVRKIAGFCAL